MTKLGKLLSEQLVNEVALKSEYADFANKIIADEIPEAVEAFVVYVVGRLAEKVKVSQDQKVTKNSLVSLVSKEWDDYSKE